MKVIRVGEEVFDIKFVHSTAEGAEHKPVTPGGLRQFVDNLAFSLKRRVAFCEISRVIQTPQVDGEIVQTFEALGQGFAVCHYNDQYNKLAGRAFALERAIASCTDAEVLTKDEVLAIADQFPKEETFLAFYFAKK